MSNPSEIDVFDPCRTWNVLLSKSSCTADMDEVSTSVAVPFTHTIDTPTHSAEIHLTMCSLHIIMY